MPRGAPRRPPTAGTAMRGTRTATLLRCDPLAGEDLGDLAVLREELVVHGLPAAEVLVDGEERLGLREVELLRDRGVDGPVAVLAEHALRVGRGDEVDERLRHVRVARGRGDRVLDQKRLVGDDE